MTFADVFSNFIDTTGFAYLIADPRCLIMIAISCVLLYLAIVKGFEPLLLVPIAFGMLLTNLPGANMFHPDYFLKVVDGATVINWSELGHGAGLIDYLYLGVKLGIYPSLIFMGVGAMTDFGPLIANPKSLLMGAGAQFGIFVAFIGAKLLGFSNAEAGSIGIIGGADGPTAIYVTLRLAPYLLGPIAVAAYSYMALVPVIQPPIMKALTTKEERRIEMKQLRPVSQKEKIIFPIMVTIFVSFMLPSAAPLIGLLMLGNLFRESGVTDRLSKTAQNELMNIVTIFLGISVGATATAHGRLRFRFRHRRRRNSCKDNEQVQQGSNQPPDRLRWRFRRSHGCPRISDSWSEGKARQLPAHARHGPQRSRCYRLRYRCRCVPCPVHVIGGIAPWLKN